MYRVDVESKGGYRFIVRSSEYELTIDADGRAITPPDTLLASLGSCVGVYLRKYAEGAKLSIGGFTVRVEGDLGKEAPYYFRRIEVAVDLKGAVIDDRRKKAMLDFIRNCPIHNTLKNGPEIDIAIG